MVSSADSSSDLQVLRGEAEEGVFHRLGRLDSIVRILGLSVHVQHAENRSETWNHELLLSSAFVSQVAEVARQEAASQAAGREGDHGGAHQLT